ncbi:response regulator [Roseateles amylovorans]|uniref:Response regulator n=1 Tax=Roseateles amylovorans TaxID=2978473 RepID=A0ABY6AS59_9BURK|nr:response regulator [Roseateles amylovorans]UXH76076.1 response regulator [Roseateles amylovorans]
MLSNTNAVKCLIVEDDPFKMEGIRNYLNQIFAGKVIVFQCQALASATALLGLHSFDLAIIDMSIHSHEPEKGAGSPFPLSSGGLDVLFEIVYSGASTPCIILTQYPDIDIESLPIPVDRAKQEILDKFDIDVAGCVRYLENDSQWKADILGILERL